MHDSSSGVNMLLFWAETPTTLINVLHPCRQPQFEQLLLNKLQCQWFLCIMRLCRGRFALHSCAHDVICWRHCCVWVEASTSWSSESSSLQHKHSETTPPSSGGGTNSMFSSTISTGRIRVVHHHYSATPCNACIILNWTFSQFITYIKMRFLDFVLLLLFDVKIVNTWILKTWSLHHVWQAFAVIHTEHIGWKISRPILISIHIGGKILIVFLFIKFKLHKEAAHRHVCICCSSSHLERPTKINATT